jgi:D-glycero-D-manno-heptose 1,7-bisphosphate phosphatase
MAVKKAVFLDKDGTLIPDIPYNVDPDLISLETGVGETLAQLAEHFELIVITNQAGIAFGRLTEKDLIGVEKRIADLLQHYGVRLSGFYYCPHHPQGSSAQYAKSCTCRKPGPGLIIKAAGELGLSLSDSWMIGDILNDVQAGKAAGCKSILIDNGNETEWDFTASPERIPDYISKDFATAGKYILRTEKNEKYNK